MRARMILAAALALAGCKSKDSAKDKAEPEGSAKGTGTGTAATAAIDAAPAALVVKLPDALPASAHAVALEPGVKLFVTIDQAGAFALGAVSADRKSWPTPRPMASLAMVSDIKRMLMDDIARGADPDALTKRIAEMPDAPAQAPAAPPPIPDPNVEPYDDHGLGLDLDEGKMGQQAPIERAREVHYAQVAWSDAAYAGLGNDVPPTSPAVVDRTTVTGVPFDGADDQIVLAVLADGGGEARALIPVLDVFGDTISLGVRDTAGGVARSIVRFGLRTGDPWHRSTELLVDLAAGGVTVRSGPGPTHGAAAWQGDAVDAAALGTAYHDAVTGQDRSDVVITVDNDVSVARFVAALDALVDAGAKELTVRNWTRPELHGPVVTMEILEVSFGEVSRTAIRPAFAALGPAIKQCYLEALQADQTLGGEAAVAVVLADGGAVRDVIVETRLPIGDCTKTAVRAISLTTPDGKGSAFSVQLRYRNLP